jgi:hypothetical protein
MQIHSLQMAYVFSAHFWTHIYMYMESTMTMPKGGGGICIEDRAKSRLYTKKKKITNDYQRTCCALMQIALNSIGVDRINLNQLMSEIRF